MSARPYSQFKERRIQSPGRGPAAGRKGTPGAEASGTTPPMKTADWPTVAARGGSRFNATTKMPVVKTTPKSLGIDA